MSQEIERSSDLPPEPTAATARLTFALVFIATLLVQLPIFDRWYAHMDEGHVLMFADIIANGGEIYRDATIYPLPGAFYLLGYAFKMFGPSVILSRWIVVLAFSLFVPLVFVWMRRLVTPAWAFGAVLVLWIYRLWTFPHWQIYSYSSVALLLLLCSMMCILRFFHYGNLRVLAAAGLFFGMGVACKQDYGAALLFAAIVTLVVSARSVHDRSAPSSLQVLCAFILPGAGVGALLALYFFSRGILPDLLQQTVINHLRGLASFEYPEIPNLFPIFAQDPALRDTPGIFSYYPGIIFTVDIESLRKSFIFRETFLLDFILKVFFYGPYPLMMAGAFRLWRRREKLRRDAERFAYLNELLLYTFGFWILVVLTINKPQDYLHFAVVYWPFLCLILVYTQSVLRKRRMLMFVTAALMIVPVGATLAYSGRLMSRVRSVNSEFVHGERAGIYAKPAEAKLLEAIVEYVHEKTEPDEIVSVIPYFPMVQFLMDRMGPHRSSYIVWPFPEFEDRDQRIIAAMEEKDVRLIIYNFTQFVNFPLMSEFSPELFRYVVENYRMEHVFAFDFSGYRMAALVRDRSTPPGRLLIEDVANAGTLRIDAEIGPATALPPGARSEYLVEDRWPFRPVIALRPTADRGSTVFSIPLAVRRGFRLRSAVGTNPRDWFVYPSYSTSFVLAVIDEDGIRDVVFERVLKPHSVLEDRGWFDVDLRLDAYVGRNVRLEFSTATQLPSGESIWGGGWATPRLVVENSLGDAPIETIASGLRGDTQVELPAGL